MALYLSVDSQVRVVSKDVNAELHCVPQLWPYPHMLDRLIGTNGKTYRFDVYIDECAQLKSLPINKIATQLTRSYELNDGPKIRGDVLLVPYKKKVNYTLEDYEAMRNILKEEELIPNGPDATYRFSSPERKTEMRMQHRPRIYASRRRLQAVLEENSDVEAYTCMELRALCKKGALSTTGTKTELAAQLLRVCMDKEEERELDMDLERLRLSLNKPSSRNSYKKEELKEYCRKKHLKVQGKKEELAARLLSNL